MFNEFQSLLLNLLVPLMASRTVLSVARGAKEVGQHYFKMSTVRESPS